MRSRKNQRRISLDQEAEEPQAPKADEAEAKPDGFRVQDIETGETIKTHESLDGLREHLGELLTKIGHAVIVRAVTKG